VDPAQRYTIDEFLLHPWATAAPAPPVQTPSVYGHLRESRPLDSPLLSAARGGRGYEGRSPGVATLKEAFDITYAVHRMEEEGARRRKYNGPGGAGARGLLTGLNEEDEYGDDEDEHGPEQNKPRHQYYQQEHMGQPHPSIVNGNAGQKNVISLVGAGTGTPSAATKTRVAAGGRRVGRKEFDLDMSNATLLGRRHNKRSSPLAGKPFGSDSPLKFEGLRMEDV
jgi:hypothetical protein